jgi:hypothetical protein
VGITPWKTDSPLFYFFARKTERPVQTFRSIREISFHVNMLYKKSPPLPSARAREAPGTMGGGQATAVSVLTSCHSGRGLGLSRVDRR